VNRRTAGLARALGMSAIVAATGAQSTLGAQSYFGQNQVQYEKFDWQVLETEHFLIYYYPEIRVATIDAARMAERAYARLSRVLDHQFREKKPIVLFASRSDFGQNNVTGDLGEGTGGVTEALRHRMLLPFTGDYRSFERVLTHELVHAFQYDIFARGRAGHGIQALQQYMPPLWFLEGMAEYLSLGPSTTQTDTWMRDAALNGRLPTLQQMTDQPQRYFPYRYGHSFWTFVAQKWGDEVIGQVMSAVPNNGFDRAIKRELGVSLEDLGDEWREELQMKHLPQTGEMDRARRFAQPLLTQRRSGGEIFLAPVLSSDGKHIAFLSNGKFSRGQVFIDLWLGDGQNGKRIRRLVKSTTDPNFEELRLLYSQSAFSPDGKLLAFTAQRGGKDVLYLMDVATRKTVRRFDLAVQAVTGPTWSPDGSQIAFSGSNGGLTDLYIVNADGTNLRRLTSDRHAAMQPQWSPDGTRIAFATDRGDGASFDVLRFPHWRIAVMHIEDGTIEVLPGQRGLNINPQWAPDSRSLIFISDRTGISNLFLYDLGEQEHYQLTNVVGAVAALTEYSPAISWAHEADRLAFTYFENGQYTVWTVANPRALKKDVYRDPVPAVPVVAAGLARRDSLARDSTDALLPAAVAAGEPASLYRTATGELRSSADAPASQETAVVPAVSISVLLDSADFALPDTTKFRHRKYSVRLMPDYAARPAIGYTPDAYGRNVFGGTTLVMSDMLGNNRLAFSGEINGRMSEARIFLGYTNLANRWQFSTGINQAPYYFLSANSLTYGDDPLQATEHQEITTYITRQLFGVTAYPLNRFTRFELGGGFNNVDRKRLFVTRQLRHGEVPGPFQLDSTAGAPTLNYLDAQLALVSDNTLFGYTGPVMGRRYRFQVSPVMGSFRWLEYLADYRRYDPIIFNFLTVATRVYANVSVGPDEGTFPKYIARPDFVRGYDRSSGLLGCPLVGANESNCSALQLLGSRVATANAELRFPLVRRFELGILPITLPPLDGLLFYDMGVAWSAGQSLYASRPADYNVTTQRFPLRSYGFGLRLNLFNYAILRWDYAVPLDHQTRKGFWTWSLWPSF
jgi:hypothetical protein